MSEGNEFNGQVIEALEQINEAINVLYKDIDERLKLIEARLPAQEWKNPYPPVYGPIPTPTCDTKAMAEAVHQALRNSLSESECQ